MKAAPTLGALVLLATCWTLRTASRAEENATLERFNRAHETLDDLGAEVIVERTIVREELDRGVALKHWSKREKEEALEKIRSAFRLTEDEKPGAVGFVPPWYSMSEARNTLMSGDPSIPTASLLDWLGWRIGALREVREEARRKLRAAALDYAEEAWLSAHNPTDLETAVRLVNGARISFDRTWSPSTYRSSSVVTKPPNTLPSRDFVSDRERVDVYDFLSVLMSAEPFFLPDPAESPDGFAVGRALWPDLVQIGHAFTLRPAIIARYHRYDSAFNILLLAAGQRLNDLIERNATAAEFEPPYLQWRALATPPPPRRQPTLDRIGTPYGIDDYRNLAIRSRPSQGMPLVRLPPPVNAAYGAWLELRKAEEAADSDRIEKARSRLLGERATLPPSTAAYVAARSLKAAATPAVAASRDEKPVDALIAQLRRFMERDTNRPRGDDKALLAAWEALRNGTAAPSNEARELRYDRWAAFPSLPGSRTLFALRDRAARQLLARLYPADATLATSTSPLTTELRERLTTAITTGSTDLAGNLLALDAAGNFLPPAEHQAWTRDAAALRNAATLLAAGQRDAARTAYLQAIRQLTEPALGEFAARQAKALRNSSAK